MRVLGGLPSRADALDAHNTGRVTRLCDRTAAYASGLLDNLVHLGSGHPPCSPTPPATPRVRLRNRSLCLDQATKGDVLDAQVEPNDLRVRSVGASRSPRILQAGRDA